MPILDGVQTWALGDDAGSPTLLLTLGLCGVSLALLLLELRRRERGALSIMVSGALATILFALAVLRPVAVATRGARVGARVVVLVDGARRLELPSGSETRRERAGRVVSALERHFDAARVTTLGFGDGAPKPLSASGPEPSRESDLLAALDALDASPAERPETIIVVSDGRLSRPTDTVDDAALELMLGGLGVPVHTVSLASEVPADASIRSVRAAGAAIAHQPLTLTVEVGCAGALDCEALPVTVRELRHGVPAATLASGVARVEDGLGTLELSIVLDRSGSRVIEVVLDAPDGDTISENDHRFVTFDVTRERIRLLHLAGRPTYDVRALRTWLKSDESVDVVAFFILRGLTDSTGAPEQELALIKFPVDELFTQHLSSFDAIILQDIDAVQYQLAQYLAPLSAYVESGGGLIMVGGPSSFAGGNYAGTALDRVLPVEQPRKRRAFDTEPLVPAYTEAGRAAPVTGKLRELLGEQLPRMGGANVVGAPRDGAIVLWEHPSLDVTGPEGTRAMPLLTLGEAGDGRAIALAVDATHALAFGDMAATVAGAAYGALWDGLLGWLMRDPRYEAARARLSGECVTGEHTWLSVSRIPGTHGDVSVALERLGTIGAPRPIAHTDTARSGETRIDLGDLEAGGYAAIVQIGDAPPTRHYFGCERGGSAFSDSRPDPDRLARIARATGGRAVDYGSVEALPVPGDRVLTAERQVTPLLPPWMWTAAAAACLGAHWLARRRGGLA